MIQNGASWQDAKDREQQDGKWVLGHARYTLRRIRGQGQSQFLCWIQEELQALGEDPDVAGRCEALRSHLQDEEQELQEALQVEQAGMGQPWEKAAWLHAREEEADVLVMRTLLQGAQQLWRNLLAHRVRDVIHG